jgi:predicted small secreted protein
MSFWRTLLLTLANNPISTFAVLCVAAVGIYLSYMTNQLLHVLTSPSWCANAIQAEKISPGSTYVGLTTCVSLLTIQLQAIATGFHISVGSFALTLIVLIVVVIAGAHATFKAGSNGIEGSVGRDAPQAAQAVADSAQSTADVIKGADPIGPAMQEPTP